MDKACGFLPYYLAVKDVSAVVDIVSDERRERFVKDTYMHKLAQPVGCAARASSSYGVRVQGAACKAASTSHIKAAADVKITSSALRSRGFQMSGCHHNRYHMYVGDDGVHVCVVADALQWMCNGRRRGRTVRSAKV